MTRESDIRINLSLMRDSVAELVKELSKLEPQSAISHELSDRASGILSKSMECFDYFAAEASERWEVPTPARTPSFPRNSKMLKKFSFLANSRSSLYDRLKQVVSDIEIGASRPVAVDEVTRFFRGAGDVLLAYSSEFTWKEFSDMCDAVNTKKHSKLLFTVSGGPYTVVDDYRTSLALDTGIAIELTRFKEVGSAIFEFNGEAVDIFCVKAVSMTEYLFNSLLGLLTQ